MTTIQIYLSANFTSILATKKQNPSLERDVVRNYHNVQGSKDELITSFIEDQHIERKDVELKVFTLKEVKSKDTKSLLSFQSKSPNLAGVELAEKVLTDRNVAFVPRTDIELSPVEALKPKKEEGEKKEKAIKEQKEKATKKKGEKKEKATREKGEKKEKTIKEQKEKAIKEQKEPRKLLKQYEDSELEQILSTARQNKGFIASFQCKKYGAQRLTGRITGARLDKRSNFIQYRIEVAFDGGIKEVLGCAWNSPSLQISDRKADALPVEETK